MHQPQQTDHKRVFNTVWLFTPPFMIAVDHAWPCMTMSPKKEVILVPSLGHWCSPLSVTMLGIFKKWIWPMLLTRHRKALWSPHQRRVLQVHQLRQVHCLPKKAAWQNVKWYRKYREQWRVLRPDLWSKSCQVLLASRLHETPDFPTFGFWVVLNSKRSWGNYVVELRREKPTDRRTNVDNTDDF